MAQYPLSPSGGSSIPTPVSIANGGTGSITKNFVDLTTAQAVAGVKNFTGNVGIGTSSPSQKLSIGSITSAVLSATPDAISLGATYSNTAGANMKLRIYEDSSNNLYGFGCSTDALDIIAKSTAGGVKIYTGSAPTQRVSILSNGNMGIGTSNPLFLLDVNGSFGLARVATTAAAYTVAVNVSIVELTAATTQTVTLPAVSTNTRRLITITNPTAVNKTLGSFLNLQGIATTTIEPYGWLTLQSDGTNWRMISGSSPVLKSLSANSLYATAIANTTLTLGELTFRYSANATNGNLEVRSSTAATVPVSFYVDRENVGFLGAYANTTSRGNVTAAINTGAFTVLNSGNIDNEQIASYRIMTGNNIYLVSIANFQSKITMSVEKKL